MKTSRLVVTVLVLALGVTTPAGTAFAGSTLPNGFTAKVVAQSGQTISGNIDAKGYDLGIYIGPGVQNVKVVGAKVTGANDEGILVQDASDSLIENSTVKGNAVNPFSTAEGTEVKAISLAGTRNVLVEHNTVEGNNHGGIGIYDDGSNSLFAPTAIDTSPVAGTGNIVSGNLVKDNLGDCGIVLSAKNSGGTVSGDVISGNNVVGYNPAAGDKIPGVGGIVVAGGSYGAVNITNNVVSNNVATGGYIPGISLHAFGTGTISGTQLTGNVLSHNGVGGVSKQTTGIEIAALGGTISGTEVLRDRISYDYYGVYHVGDTNTTISNLMTNNVTVAVGP